MRRSLSRRFLYDSNGDLLSVEATELAVASASAAQAALQMEAEDRDGEARAGLAFRRRQGALVDRAGGSGSDRSRSPIPASAARGGPPTTHRLPFFVAAAPPDVGSTPMATDAATHAATAPDPTAMATDAATSDRNDWRAQRAARDAMWLETQPTRADFDSWIEEGLRRVDLTQCPECFLPAGTRVRIRSHAHGWHEIVAGEYGWSWVSRTPLPAPMVRWP